MTTKNIKNILAACFVSCCMTAPFVSCSDEHMQAINTDNTKTLTTDPNGQLTTVPSSPTGYGLTSALFLPLRIEM